MSTRTKNALPLQALTVEQAAKRLGVSPQQVHNLVEEGKLQALNIAATGTRKLLRVPNESLQTFTRNPT